MPGPPSATLTRATPFAGSATVRTRMGRAAPNLIALETRLPRTSSTACQSPRTTRPSARQIESDGGAGVLGQRLEVDCQRLRHFADIYFLEFEPQLAGGDTRHIPKRHRPLDEECHHQSICSNPCTSFSGARFAFATARRKKRDATDDCGHRITQFVGREGQKAVAGGDLLGKRSLYRFAGTLQRHRRLWRLATWYARPTHNIRSDVKVRLSVASQVVRFW